MTDDRLRFAESVLGSLNGFQDDDRAAARRAVEMIADDPLTGVPLSSPVEGYWSLRSGAIRILYRLIPQSGHVVVLRITKPEETHA